MKIKEILKISYIPAVVASLCCLSPVILVTLRVVFYRVRRFALG